MTDLSSWLLAATAFAGLISLIVWASYERALRSIQWRDRPDPHAAPDCLVSVIVPARNEALDLEASLRSLLAQRGVRFEIIVVNDHSTDATGLIADDLAGTDRRLKVIHDPPLPPGWFGKVNAMRCGAERARGDILLFTDADILHAPGTLRVALAELQKQQLQFLSLFPRVRCVSFWEHALLPLFVAGLAQFAGGRLKDADTDQALAAGAFMMIRRETFQAVGGWDCVRQEMLDDVMLAKQLKRRGYRVGFHVAPELLEVRLYKGNRDAFWGTTKNILGGLHGMLWLAPIAILLPWIVFVAPLLSIGWGLLHHELTLVVAGATVYLIQWCTCLRTRSLFDFRWWKSLGFPSVALLTTCCFSRALWNRWWRKSVVWRGRALPVAEKPPSK